MIIKKKDRIIANKKILKLVTFENKLTNLFYKKHFSCNKLLFFI